MKMLTFMNAAVKLPVLRHRQNLFGVVVMNRSDPRNFATSRVCQCGMPGKRRSVVMTVYGEKSILRMVSGIHRSMAFLTQNLSWVLMKRVPTSQR